MQPADGDDYGFGERSRYAAHLDRGWALFERGDFSAARHSGHEAHQLLPDLPDAPMLLAAAALAVGDPERALVWYRKALEIDGDYVEAFIAAVGVMLFDLDDPRGALEMTRQRFDLDEATPADLAELALLEASASFRLEEFDAARRTLSECADLVELHTLLHAEEPDWADTTTWVGVNDDPESLDEDERAQVEDRMAAISLRWGRLMLDLRDVTSAVDVARRLTKRWPDDPEAWALLEEALIVDGDPRGAVHAALQVYRLDAEAPSPPWLPEPQTVHTGVVSVLRDCPNPEIRGVAAVGLVVLVHDAPSLELVLEGVDPRAPVLATSVRGFGGPDGKLASPSAELTGLSVYRRNLARRCPSAEDFNEVLTRAVLEELAGALRIPDEGRVSLGLEPLTELGRAPAAALPAKAGLGSEDAVESSSRASKKSAKTKGAKKKSAKKTAKKSPKEKTAKKASKKTPKKTPKKAPKKASKKTSKKASKKTSKKTSEKKGAKKKTSRGKG